jgi:hypothetical protein
MSNIGTEYETFGGTSNAAGVTIRDATADDDRALERLAQLDSSRPPAGPIVLAEVNGELRAAYSIDERRVIADPFRRTVELVDLLLLRANHIDGGTKRTRGRRSAVPQPPGLRLGLIPRLGRRAA